MSTAGAIDLRNGGDTDPPVGNCCLPAWQSGAPIIRTIPTADSERSAAPRLERRNPALARQETWRRDACANKIQEFRGNIMCTDLILRIRECGLSGLSVH